MVRILENTSKRLSQTDAHHFGYGAMLILLLFGEVGSLGAATQLGAFGVLFFALWTIGLVLFISQYKWTTAVFDAETQSLQATMRWISGRRRTTTRNLSNIANLLWDEITLWAELASSPEKAEEVQRNLIVRKRWEPAKTGQSGRWDYAEADALIAKWLNEHAKGKA